MPTLEAVEEGRIKRSKASGNCLVGYVSAPFRRRFIEASPNMAVPACRRRPTNGRFRRFPSRAPFKAADNQTITRRFNFNNEENHTIRGGFK